MKFKWYSVLIFLVTLIPLTRLTVAIVMTESQNYVPLIICSILAGSSLALMFFDAWWNKCQEVKATKEKKEVKQPKAMPSIFTKINVLVAGASTVVLMIAYFA